MGSSNSKSLLILGIRGIPAAHGGFETFAERLALWLRDRGWSVTVYCQGSRSGTVQEDDWEGIHRVHIPVKAGGAYGTIEFDIKATADALRRPGKVLTLGYNTGFLSALLRARKRLNLINMDGLEWKRNKYSALAKAYLWLNERLAAWSGDHLIADHPIIADHLASRVSRNKIVTIPYGSDAIEHPDPAPLLPLGLEPGRYLTLIARPEPENSIAEIVRAFSARPRNVRLAVLGQYQRTHSFQRAILDSASDEVSFVGPIYEKQAVAALRYHSLAYVHGHRVGGTNPSLVEALGAGNAVIAHDNPFNRWVAGDAAVYFRDEAECALAFDRIIADAEQRQRMSREACRRWRSEFTWPLVLEAYCALLDKDE